MRVLLDADVLMRSANTDHAEYPIAEKALAELRRQSTLFLVPQVLYEFWVVATRPVDVRGGGFKPHEAKIWVDYFMRYYDVLHDDLDIFDHWYDIVTTQPCVGKIAHDARLVAAMKSHALTHVLSFNFTDFVRFKDIQALDPRKVAVA